jgi:hypothetical protein
MREGQKGVRFRYKVIEEMNWWGYSGMGIAYSAHALRAGYFGGWGK